MEHQGDEGQESLTEITHLHTRRIVCVWEIEHVGRMRIQRKQTCVTLMLITLRYLYRYHTGMSMRQLNHL